VSGETDLDQLLQGMSAKLHHGLYVFVTLPHGSDTAKFNPRMTFHEDEGLTVICERDAALEYGVAYEFPCHMITLEIHSSLEAVGFLARITAHLAKLGMGVNPVSGFYHDHLFVPEGRGEEAIEALKELAG